MKILSDVPPENSLEVFEDSKCKLDVFKSTSGNSSRWSFRIAFGSFPILRAFAKVPLGNLRYPKFMKVPRRMLPEVPLFQKNSGNSGRFPDVSLENLPVLFR